MWESFPDLSIHLYLCIPTLAWGYTHTLHVHGYVSNSDLHWYGIVYTSYIFCKVLDWLVAEWFNVSRSHSGCFYHLLSKSYIIALATVSTYYNGSRRNAINIVLSNVWMLVFFIWLRLLWLFGSDLYKESILYIFLSRA